MHEDQWIAPTADYDTPCWHYRLTVRLQCHIWCNTLLEGVMGYFSDEYLFQMDLFLDEFIC